MKKELMLAIWTLVSISVGAGIFGLPYVAQKAGLLTGIIVMILVAILMTWFTLYLGEIVLRTREKHQLTGLAEKYLGKKGKVVMLIANALSIYGALAAYTVGGGQALGIIFTGGKLFYSLLFLIVFGLAVYFGLRIFKKVEGILTPLKILVAVVLSLAIIPFIQRSNLTGFSLSGVMIPYGIAVFAFTAISAIPEINEEIRNKFNLKKGIIYGMLITLIIYLLFVFSVVGVTGSNTSEVATTALGGALGFKIALLVNLFAFLAMATAFVALGFALKENFTLDCRVKNFNAWIFVVGVPLILILGGFADFIKLLEFSGAIAIAVILFLIMLMHSRAKKLGDREPEYELKDNKLLKTVLLIILLLGIFYSLLGWF